MKVIELNDKSKSKSLPLATSTVFDVTKHIRLVPPFQEKELQVGKDQEKVQSEKDSHSKNRGGKKPN